MSRHLGKWYCILSLPILTIISYPVRRLYNLQAGALNMTYERETIDSETNSFHFKENSLDQFRVCIIMYRKLVWLTTSSYIYAWLDTT